MAYFSNGTEGMEYESRYCDRCVNNRPVKGMPEMKACPVWDLHHEYNYAQCKTETEIGKTLNEILESFIPTDAQSFAGECLMFLESTQTQDEQEAQWEKLLFGEAK